MIEKEYDCNKPDRYGWTPIHYAVQYGHKSAVELLVRKGADLNMPILSGKTPWNMAMERSHGDVAQLLESRGAKQNLPNFRVLEGSYFGQKPSGDKPEVFVLGIVSTPLGEHGCVTFSPDGKNVFWSTEYKQSGSIGAFKVFTSSIEDNQWTAPQYAFITGDLLVNDDVPFVSTDGKYLFLTAEETGIMTYTGLMQRLLKNCSRRNNTCLIHQKVFVDECHRSH